MSLFCRPNEVIKTANKELSEDNPETKGGPSKHDNLPPGDVRRKQRGLTNRIMIQAEMTSE